jgi:hypothetical protein
VYVGEVHRAKVEGDFVVVRVCKRCRGKFRARVHAEGGGAAQAPFFIGGTAAAQRAQQRATDDAQGYAEGLARIAACPGCAHRERGRLVGAAIWDGILLFLVIVLFGGAATLIITMIAFESPPVSTASGAGVVALGLWSGIRKGRRTLHGEQVTADKMVLWFFCAGCRKKISQKEDAQPWSTCTHCARAVHEGCAPDHATTHVAVSAYR